MSQPEQRPSEHYDLHRTWTPITYKSELQLHFFDHETREAIRS